VTVASTALKFWKLKTDMIINFMQTTNIEKIKDKEDVPQSIILT
jgi:hypothetical protein